MGDGQISSRPTVVLVVDHDVLARTDAAAELRREGFEVLEAADVREAITVLQLHTVDVLLSQLDPVSGESLAQWVQKRRPATDVVWAPPVEAGEMALVLH